MVDRFEIFEGTARLGNDPGDRFSAEWAEPRTGLNGGASDG